VFPERKSSVQVVAARETGRIEKQIWVFSGIFAECAASDFPSVNNILFAFFFGLVFD
jgi:hypothetical protein